VTGEPLGVGALAGAIAFALSPVARALAARIGLVDRPDARKDHAGAVPLLGGAAVLAAVAVAVLVSGGVPGAWGAVAGTGLAFAVGLLDDARKASFPSGAKLAGQVAAAAVGVAGGIRLDLLSPPAADALLSGVFLVAAMNAVNFLDNMDGLAAGLLAVGAGALAFVPAGGRLAAAALAGGCLGFLPWNYPRPRIFLGDAGAHGLGFALASLAIAATRETGRAAPIALALALPLLDLARVAAMRAVARRPLHRADRLHLSFLLVGAGLSRNAAVPLLWALAAVLAAVPALLALPIYAAFAAAIRVYQRTTSAAS